MKDFVNQYLNTKISCNNGYSNINKRGSNIQYGGTNGISIQQYLTNYLNNESLMYEDSQEKIGKEFWKNT